MKIVYLPLVERPCNVLFPIEQLPTQVSNDVSILPKQLLGDRKQPADLEGSWLWLEKELQHADAAVISLEMLIYGGLLPSRMHHTDLDILHQRLMRFAHCIRTCKAVNGLKVYLFGLILRTPAYSSSEEEPDYYANYGWELFRRAYLEDQSKDTILTEQELLELGEISGTLPKSIQDDFEYRRMINRTILEEAAELVADKSVDLFVIPQDDTARYGYGPSDKRLIFKKLDTLGISDEVLTYPGADEVGCSLVCRSIVEHFCTHDKRPSLFIEFDDKQAEQSIAKYEGIPLIESIRSHILASGARIASGLGEADALLAVNTGPEPMLEACKQDRRQRSQFLRRINNLSKQYSIPIALADVAYANGGDSSLLHAIDKDNLWNTIHAYAGWNTSGNTLGTVISLITLQLLFEDPSVRERNLAYRILDDWAYQTVVSTELMTQGESDHDQVVFSTLEPHVNRLKEVLQDILPRFKSTKWNRSATPGTDCSR